MAHILSVLAACVLALSMLANGSDVRAAEGADADVAGLVISYGGDAFSYATVPLHGERIDGIGLLNRSGLAVLAIDLGGYGQGVCMIERTGCEVSACRTRLCQTADSGSPFWRYLLGADAGWVMSPLGASGTTVEAGKVYAWAWSGGQGVPADMPALSLAEVMERSGFDTQERSPALTSVGLAIGSRDDAPVRAYLAAAVILVIVGGGGMFLVRRSTTRSRMRAG